METINITKHDLMDLATIVSKRKPGNEDLCLISLATHWKVQSIHPTTKEHTLVAFIPKQNNDVDIDTDNMGTGLPDSHHSVDLTQVPTLCRAYQRGNEKPPANR